MTNALMEVLWAKPWAVLAVALNCVVVAILIRLVLLLRGQVAEQEELVALAEKHHRRTRNPG